jgi:hypothetical protein
MLQKRERGRCCVQGREECSRDTRLRQWVFAFGCVAFGTEALAL